MFNNSHKHSGTGAPHFLFATGIENSYPTIRLPDGSQKRVDEMEKTRHYERWREDFGLVKDLGIEFLRGKIRSTRSGRKARRSERGESLLRRADSP